MTNPATNKNDETPEPTRGDRLDALLRNWHDENKSAARASRDAIVSQLDGDLARERRPSVIGRIGFARLLSAAAIFAFAALLTFFFIRSNERAAFAGDGIVQVAEGGALDALDQDGNTLGTCPLQRTDVKVEISGLFARTIVEQTYANPYPRTIEAVYTFPLSNRAAVDRMTMIVKGPNGEKFVEGEVKERSIARAIYEEARESGYVASLLEQERPNIFTQSVANIEPGATVKVRIATIELAQRRNGIAEYVFPMVVGPRYIPGAPKSLPTLPEGWTVREGVVLRAPAGVEIAADTPFSAGTLTRLLESAIPVRAASSQQVDELLALGEGIRFTAKYGNGSSERGVYFAMRGLGELNGRFFYAPMGKEQGAGFAGDTDQVPDASKITPMPVKPAERAGHDISVAVSIDSGGPAITDVASEQHAISVESRNASSRQVTLDDKKTIPNRDFILRWKVADAAIEPAFFAHTSESTDASVKGGYFALMLEPPARVAPAEIRPRELVFVLDTSGSMNGFPIEKSKALARKAIAAMRPNDTFNFITFAGATRVLWSEPRAASDENRKFAEDFVNGLSGGGGTEMMNVINTALVQEGRSGIAPAKLLDLPADGRGVRVAVPHDGFRQDGGAWKLDAGAGRLVPVELSIAIPSNPKKLAFIVDGTWETRNGDRVLVTKSGKFEDADARTRFVFFLTDGYIGNDQAIVAAVRENARASRVFSFGIGNSVNRFLLDEMARAGRGTCEVVTLSEEADAVIDRLVRRIESPVLTDIALEIAPSLGIRELLPAGDHLPDLYDQEPIVLLGRFDRAASGAITVRGRTGAGAWERTINVALPAAEAKHDVVKTLWARGKVDEILLPKLAEVESQTLDAPTKRAVIRLGESYSIATPFTSFVAVEKSRVVIGGKPMLVAVPVELPDGTNWEGFFGEGVQPAQVVDALTRGEPTIASASLDDGSRFWFADANDAKAKSEGASSRADPLGVGGGVGGAVGKPGSSAPAGMSGRRMPSGEQGQRRREIFASTAQRDAGRPGAPGGALGGAPAPTPATGRAAGGFSGGLVGGGGGTGGAAAPSDAAGNVRKQSEVIAENSGVLQSAPNTVVFSREMLAAETEEKDAAAPAEAAKTATPSVLTDAERNQLVRRLDRRLVALALAHLLGQGESIPRLAAELGLDMQNGTLLVAMKADLNAKTKDALAALGCTVVAEEPARSLLVVRVSVAQLAKLPATAGVKRVEPLASRAAGG
ncbi:MAG: hypothetical protein RIT24_1276 [Planctomycetota bacterium]